MNADQDIATEDITEPGPTGMSMDDDVPGDVDMLPAETAAAIQDADANTPQLSDGCRVDAVEDDGQGRMCVLPEKSEALPGPASGWQAAVAGTTAHEMPADDGMDPDEEHVGNHVEVQDDMGQDAVTPDVDRAEGGNTLQFFFMDALYEPAMVGTVVMVGKVKQHSEYVSACVCVKGMRQCLYVVPKPFVFQDPDGDIARCAIPS